MKTMELICSDQNNMTDLEKLNEFLIKVANYDKVGIRRKILSIRKYIELLEKQSEEMEENKWKDEIF